MFVPLLSGFAFASLGKFYNSDGKAYNYSGNSIMAFANLD